MPDPCCDGVYGLVDLAGRYAVLDEDGTISWQTAPCYPFYDRGDAEACLAIVGTVGVRVATRAQAT